MRTVQSFTNKEKKLTFMIMSVKKGSLEERRFLSKASLIDSSFRVKFSQCCTRPPVKSGPTRSISESCSQQLLFLVSNGEITCDHSHTGDRYTYFIVFRKVFKDKYIQMLVVVTIFFFSQLSQVSLHKTKLVQK